MVIKKLLIVLLIGLVSCAEPEPDYKSDFFAEIAEMEKADSIREAQSPLIQDIGKIAGFTYINEEIGLTIELPPDWEINDFDDIAAWEEAYNDSCSYYDRIEHDYAQSMTLFESSMSTGETLMDFPCTIFCMVAALDTYTDEMGNPCSSELEYIRYLADEYRIGEQNTSIFYDTYLDDGEQKRNPVKAQAVEVLNDIKFYTWTDKTVLYEEDQRSFYLKFYIKKMENFFLIFQLNYLGYKPCSDQIDPALQTIVLTDIVNENALD